jgi:hypothetical protein
MAVPGVSADSNDESEFIPTTVIVRFVDAHAVHEQAHDKCDRSDEPVPKPAEKSGGLSPWLFVFRV